MKGRAGGQNRVDTERIVHHLERWDCLRDLTETEPMPASGSCLPQAAAIPVQDGLVCLVTSSSGKHWVVPKGSVEQGRSVGEQAEWGFR